MLIDYLRYLAFHGRLRAFVRDGYRDFVGGRVVNGLHLRIPDADMQLATGVFPPWGGLGLGLPADWIAYRSLGIRRTGRIVDKKIGASTFEYEEERPVGLEAVIDIDPRSWSEELGETRRADFGLVRFRRSPPAMGHLASGDPIFDTDRGPRGHGTLAGIFCSRSGSSYALTCAHVAKAQANLALARTRRWPIPWRTQERLGQVCHAVLPPAYTGSPKDELMIDASLARLERGGPPGTSPLPPVAAKSTAGMFQEEPVHFRSGVRNQDVRARIAAVTVWKAIDLFRDNQLRDLGDMLMLGPPGFIYAPTTVSRPGDSGAAVKGGWPQGPDPVQPDWYGMIVGADQAGAYATYAETLWNWATEQIDAGSLDFFYRQ